MAGAQILPTQTCFDDAVELIEGLVMHNVGMEPRVRLVHAICLMPDDTPYAHAWVEVDGKDCLFRGIVDGEVHDFGVFKHEYYANLRVQECTHYTVREMLRHNVRTNHYGPWKEKYKALCGQNARASFYLTRHRKTGTPGIRCNQCGHISYNPNDVKERYCGKCNLFLVNQEDV